MPSKPTQLKNKKWAIRAFWTTPDGQRHEKYKSGFDRAKEAKDWAIDYERKFEDLSSGSDKVLLKNYLDEWIKLKSKLSTNTIAGYRVNIKKIKAEIGDIPLHQLRLSHIQGLIDAQATKPRTTIYMYRTLHAALEWACKDRILDSNPAKYAELPSDEDVFEATILDSSEIVKQLLLLKEQHSPFYLPVLISVTLGCRRGEALGLKWCDVDFKNNTATIKEQYTRNGTEGAIHKPVKTKKSDRVCEMPKLLKEELARIKEEQKTNGVIETYVCAADGELPNLNTLNRKLKAFQKANNLVQCRFHDLRHSFAMLQLEGGTDIKTLSEILGHSKTGITTDFYLQGSKPLKKKAAAKIDKLLAPKFRKNSVKSFKAIEK